MHYYDKCRFGKPSRLAIEKKESFEHEQMKSPFFSLQDIEDLKSPKAVNMKVNGKD